MSMTERQELIVKLLDENGFLTVQKLAELTYTSQSSIRRDLARLHDMCFVKRTHGGAKSLNADNNPAPFFNRVSQNATAKRIIAKKAAGFLADGQTIMLDGSSTAGFLIPYIAKHRDIMLYTNNMVTAINAVSYGIKTHCIGGTSVNNSVILSGTESYRAAERLHPDILFFSSHALDKNGIISDPTEEENYLRFVMLNNSVKSIFLCDSEKFNRRSLYTLTSVNNTDAAIFDTEYKDLTASCKIL